MMHGVEVATDDSRGVGDVKVKNVEITDPWYLNQWNDQNTKLELFVSIILFCSVYVIRYWTSKNYKCIFPVANNIWFQQLKKKLKQNHLKINCKHLIKPFQRTKVFDRK